MNRQAARPPRNIGLPQLRRGGEMEMPLITSGDMVATIARFLRPGADSYSAADVVEHLLSKTTAIPGREPLRRETA